VSYVYMSQYIPDEYLKKLQANQVTDNDKKRFSEWMRHADPNEIEAIVEKIGCYYENQDDEPFIPLSLSQAIERRIGEAKVSKFHILTRQRLTIAAAVAGIIFAFYCPRQ
jgi:hypothetical protein